MKINAVDRVEILTLQDNFIEITAMDNSDTVARARYLLEGRISNSILAEHGFSALVSITRDGRTAGILFDFGFSAIGAAYNARALKADLGSVKALVLSHGHSDHFGGLEGLLGILRETRKERLGIVLHPGVFKRSRYLRFGSQKSYFPELARDRLEQMGLNVMESSSPLAILDGDALFLGEIEKSTEYEKGMPFAFHDVGGRESQDTIEDDSALAMHLDGKGLVVLSGCAHSGIINTLRYAMKVTAVDRVHAVMGGFHLAGPAFEQAVAPTIKALREICPDYVIPTHCTGRSTAAAIEKSMPRNFILNMSGTKLTFRSRKESGTDGQV